jgi:hypothetical protein
VKDYHYARNHAQISSVLSEVFAFGAKVTRTFSYTKDSSIEGSNAMIGLKLLWHSLLLHSSAVSLIGFVEWILPEVLSLWR